MAIGEDGRPHGVSKGGIRASGVKGGCGSEDRPVPPIIAIGTGSAASQSSIMGKRERKGITCVCGWEVLHYGGFLGGRREVRKGLRR